jgi:predicted SnoaL-like aldol condensation-catalyzing enzyme
MQQSREHMASDSQASRNKEIVKRFIEEVLNGGDLGAADELVKHDFVSHGWRVEDRGPAAVKHFAGLQRREAPDWHITIHDLVAEGDRVTVRATGRGTRLVANEMVSAELVGREVAIDWIAIYRMADGQIAERWVVASGARATD